MINNRIKTSVAIFGVLAAMILATVMSVQSASALIQDNGRVFAPGQVKVSESDSQSANVFAPGALEKVVEQHGRLPGGGCIASINSPGHLFKLEPTTTDINP